MEPHDLFKQTKHPEGVNDLYHIFNLPNVLNVVYWDRYFKMIEGVDGDIVECGIGRGRSLITILALNLLFEGDGKLRAGARRTVFALDSFEGFPEPSFQDKSPRNPKKGDWSKSPNKQFDYSVSNLLRILESAGLNQYLKFGPPDAVFANEEKLRVIEGFFDKTTQTLELSQIALLHLDGDLYESVRDPLNNLANRIAVGGVVVIDDYLLEKRLIAEEKFPGARLAVDEFLESAPNFSVGRSIRGTPYLIRTY